MLHEGTIELPPITHLGQFSAYYNESRHSMNGSKVGVGDEAGNRFGTSNSNDLQEMARGDAILEVDSYHDEMEDSNLGADTFHYPEQLLEQDHYLSLEGPEGDEEFNIAVFRDESSNGSDMSVQEAATIAHINADTHPLTDRDLDTIAVPNTVLTDFSLSSVVSSNKYVPCLKRLIRKELLILGILLRTRRSERLALDPHLDFTDDGKIHLGRKRCLARDPRENVHGLAVQQRFILIQLIARQTIDLLL